MVEESSLLHRQVYPSRRFRCELPRALSTNCAMFRAHLDPKPKATYPRPMPLPSEHELRKTIVEVCRRMWVRRLVAGTEGNVSARLGGDRFLVTPAASDKGFMDGGDLVLVDGTGTPLGRGTPTSELPLHLEVYAIRPDIGAVVHAHPPAVVAATLAEVDITRPVLPEAILALRGVGVAEYQRPGTKALARSAAESVRSCDSGVLNQHGAITVGSHPVDALHRMEMLEAVADALLRAHAVGRVRDLPQEEQTALRALLQK